jgi:hypothetical protein
MTELPASRAQEAAIASDPHHHLSDTEPDHLAVAQLTAFTCARGSNSAAVQ